ncbi:CBS domain-containing protein [Jidongwangia harbinensis]|uniref:CBS domain-containing protein n=1 Tax=Jidongwangia harbinensis TaxID=2878561 RepID=UPI001CDA4473|nr:CBS domain-containing protein [Jidongwangia harbinensis]MCA2219310.1 CBS domain-containing protein [Jidongwangia harbinensis]
MRQWLVQDVMTRDVLTVAPDTPYREIVDSLVRRQVTAAPVVDGDRRVIGVVSEADLLHKVEFIGEEHERRTFERSSRRSARAKAHAAVAADLMTTPAITALPETSVVAAARRMEGDRVKRLPVVDGDGLLVGIVSRRDLLRMHMRPDPAIREDIVEYVLRRALWIDPVCVEVDVVDGRVMLAGRLERRSTAGLAVRLTAEVPGVVAVTDRLAWDYDDSRLVRASGYAFGDSVQLVRPGTE